MKTKIWGAVLGLALLGWLVSQFSPQKDKPAPRASESKQPSTTTATPIPAPNGGITAIPIPSATAAKAKLPIQLGWSEAESFLRSRGYPTIRPSGDPKSLRGADEHCDGEECRGRRPVIQFDYSSPNDEGPPRCVSIMHAFPIEWRRLVDEFSGADASKLPPPFPLKPGRYESRVQTLSSPVGEIRVIVGPDGVEVSMGAGCEL